jgi:hypothetical protein
MNVTCLWDAAFPADYFILCPVMEIESKVINGHGQSVYIILELWMTSGDELG